jgi:hypothetical protein
MYLESEKRLNIQLRLDFSSMPTGEARQAGRGDLDGCRQGAQVGLRRQVGEIVFFLSRRTVFADEPSLLPGEMLLPLVPDPLRWSVGDSHANRSKTGLELPFVPVRQLIVCHLAWVSMSSAGIDRTSGTCRGPSSASGGLSAGRLPIASRKRVNSRRANGAARGRRMRLNDCTRSSNGGSRPRLCCPLRRQRPCCSGHCSLPVRSPCERSTDGRR